MGSSSASRASCRLKSSLEESLDTATGANGGCSEIDFVALAFARVSFEVARVVLVVDGLVDCSEGDFVMTEDGEGRVGAGTA